MKDKIIKAWTPEYHKISIFKIGSDKDIQWARILKTKKQVKKLYPECKAIRLEIKIRGVKQLENFNTFNK